MDMLSLLTFIGLVAILCSVAIAWIRWYYRIHYQASPLPEAVNFATTADGWHLALHHYPPQGKRLVKHPVILCHGLGCNALTFDPHPKASWARSLAEQGCDVFALELRGHGFSRHGKGRHEKWTFADYLKHDIPAAIDKVCSLTNSPEVHWVGLSMGGILIYCYLGASAPQNTHRVRSATTLGSALDLCNSGSGYRRLSHLTQVFGWLGWHYPNLFYTLYAPFAGRFANICERFLLWETNMDPIVTRTIMVHGFHPIPHDVMAPLASLLTPSGLRAENGERYFDRLKEIRCPILAFGANRDFQIPYRAVIDTFEHIGSEHKKYVAVGNRSQPVGHMDLVLGKQTPTQVTPEVLSWLKMHD